MAKDEKKEKKEYVGQETFPTLFIWTCVLINLVGIGAVLMLIVAEVVLIVNNFNNYVDQYGHSYPARNYVGDEGCGYVSWTNAPKHIGSAVWMLLYQLALIVFATLVIGSDLAWRQATYSTWGRSYVNMFYAPGILEGAHNKGLYYYVIANALLKIYLVILFMSQSFYGLKGGSHAPPDNLGPVHGSFSGGGGGGGGIGGIVTVTSVVPATASRATTVVINTAAATATAAIHAGASIITGPSGGSIVTREEERAVGMAGYGMDDAFALTRRGGPDLDDPAGAWGTQLWVQFAGWIVLGSVLPSIIAYNYLVPWAASRNEKKDTEKGSGA